jgi:hypothetical protein
MLRRTVRVVLPGLVLLPFLSACGGAGSSGAVEVPSITASFSPTRERPTPTRTPTGSPDEPDTSAPGPTSAPTSEPTTREPAPTSTPPETSSTPTAPASTPEESPSAEPAGGTADEEEDSSGDWWWLLIPVLAVAAIVGLLLQRRARNRRAWRARLATAEGEVGWFARDLIPQLRGAGSPAGVSGGWTVAEPRVASLDDSLTRLVTTAPGDDERARASALQGAVRAARDKVAAVVAAGDSSTQQSLDLDDAQAPLLAVLVPQPASGAGEPTGS